MRSQSAKKAAKKPEIHRVPWLASELGSKGAVLAFVMSLSGCDWPLEAAAAGENRTTNSVELVSLVRALETEKPPCVERNTSGAIVFLALPESLLTDSNLFLISRIDTLREAKLYGFHSKEKITGSGIAALLSLTNLVGLRLWCFGECREEIWRAVCNLRELRRLHLNVTQAAGGDYSGLTNLVRLEELSIANDAKFDDETLSQVANLPLLRSLSLNGTGVSGQWTNILRNCRSLTNVWVRNSVKTM